ncbi:SMC-Scp complex subunit ScpB [Polymorphobacter megasporae]|uniref:SMC-Scp complex subunit ScpB n=1 Tax=Glacieibacterium megasporae TaxID=2835787 RepID=UPI001C1E8D07|nr:SMC-Scp complex subunit ScpB [Polymorphobacter megasporae]UAJ11578.1 SMC-Scp complex subunit ScpB [Polymorphobacter megasporae]
MTDPQLVREVEAIVFAAEHPVTLAEIARHVSEPGDIAAALADLAASYAPRGIVLVERGGRWLFQTAPDLGHLLRRTREAPRKLSRAAVETLAIIAYHEPATRAEIEDIRGVAVSPGTVDVLMAAGWVRPAGRRESPGRPLQFATTPGFLADFGLADRRDLPGVADLRAAGLLDRVPPGASTGEIADAGLHSER